MKELIFGLIGNPVKHSLSPLMHNAAFRQLKINAEYRLFDIQPQELNNFLHSLSEKDIRGLNVTIPYKEVVLEYLKWQSSEVKFIGAANTLMVKEDKYLAGWNTDGVGFHAHLTKDLKFNPSAKRVVCLGAGGAAKAIVNQLGNCGVKAICVYDLDQDKALKLVEKIKEHFPSCDAKVVDSLQGLDIKNADLLINATPIGMKQTDPSLIDSRVLHPKILVYDLIYNPPITRLLKEAKERGAQVSNGLGMLLYQGARSFELWTGERAPIEIMRGALEEGVRNL